MNVDVDSDGFQIARPKRNRKNNKKNKNITKVFAEECFYIEVARRQLLDSHRELVNSEYVKGVESAILAELPGPKSNIELLCFGLGHVGDSHASRAQFGCFIFMRDIFIPRKTTIADPIFWKKEVELLKDFEVDILHENSEGCYVIEVDCYTVAFFPHCPHQLTNNFLWSNWHPARLSKLLLICNSFTSLHESLSEKKFSSELAYIHKIFSHTKEVVIKNNYTSDDVFNDLSLHVFSKEKLDQLPAEFWIKKSKPQYKNCEDFITAKMIECLNLGND